MLKFNKYPPQIPSDVTLTEAAIKSITEIGREEDADIITLHSYGEAMGRVIMASFDSAPDGELLRGIYQNLAEALPGVQPTIAGLHDGMFYSGKLESEVSHV